MKRRNVAIPADAAIVGPAAASTEGFASVHAGQYDGTKVCRCTTGGASKGQFYCTIEERMNG